MDRQSCKGNGVKFWKVEIRLLLKRIYCMENFLNRSFNHIICHRFQQAKLSSANEERIRCSVYNWKEKHLKKKNHKHRAVCQTLLSRKYWYLILVFFMLLGWGSKFLFGQNSHSCLSLDFCLSRSDKNLPFCTPVWFSALSYKF